MGGESKRKGGLWARLRSPAVDEAEHAQPVRDVLDLYPELRPLQERAAAGDWRGVTGFLAGLPDPDDHMFAVEYVVNLPGVEEMLQRAVDAEPGEALPAAMLGARTVVQGWDVRGGGRASTVSRQQFDTFHDYLRHADTIFLDVLAREPADVVANGYRLASAMGLSLGQNEVVRRYRQLAAHHPHFYAPQRVVLQTLCPKWGGTWESAWSFATECAAAAPVPSSCAALVPEFHLERWLDLTGAEAKGYFSRSDVHTDVLRAAENSVLHEDYRKRLGWVSLHGLFALCFSLADDHQRTVEQFVRLDNKMSDGPWENYFGDPLKQYVTRRHRAQQALGA